MSSKTIENVADCNGQDDRRLVMWRVVSKDDVGILLFDLDASFRLFQYEEATLAMFNHALLRMNER